MTLYEITTDDGVGFAQYILRKRADAASLALRNAVYRAADAQGIRDTARAHRAMALADGWTKQCVYLPIQVGGHAITISVETLP